MKYGLLQKTELNKIYHCIFAVRFINKKEMVRHAVDSL